MKTRKLELQCPVCKSGDVFYSCTPNCCFNHVCNECGATFEPATLLKGGGRSTGVEPPEPLPDPADPTVACVRCESTAVYMTETGDSLICSGCGAALSLEYTEVCPG